jgi:hypothetical protein
VYDSTPDRNYATQQNADHQDDLPAQNLYGENLAESNIPHSIPPLTQLFDIRHVCQGENLILERPLFYFGEDHDGLVTLVQRAVRLDDGRSDDPAAEILVILEIDRLDDSSLREAVDLVATFCLCPPTS